MQLEGDNVLQDDPSLTNVHYLGTDARKQYWFDGEIAKLSLWDSCLDAQQVSAVLDESLSGSEEGLLHAYVLDPDALSTADPIVDDLKENGIDPETDLEINQNIDFGSTAAAFAEGQGDFTTEKSLTLHP